jgi:transcriptional regulator with XRE-family HTH domain
MKASEQLLRWRKKARLTQTEAATSLGIQLSHYQKLEYETAGPSLRLAGKIQEVTGVPVANWISSPKAG